MGQFQKWATRFATGISGTWTGIAMIVLASLKRGARNNHAIRSGVRQYEHTLAVLPNIST